jgi:SAM-dependent methyltransferase
MQYKVLQDIFGNLFFGPCLKSTEIDFFFLRDCGLGMCDYLNQLVCQQEIDFNHNVILELGSGTGLVGIYAAQLLAPKQVYLTDLEDALQIMRQNADLVQDKKCEMIVEELAWGPDADPRYNHVDLVLLTDVLYNQSSHDVLLDTLSWLLKPGTKALLAYKERNPDERAFFTKVKERGFECNFVNNDHNALWEFYWIEKQSSTNTLKGI